MADPKPLRDNLLKLGLGQRMLRHIAVPAKG
jgi:hypothetical protein